MSLLPLSAHTPEALRALARAVSSQLRGRPPLALHDLCYTAAARRGHQDHRLSVLADSVSGLAEELDAFVTGEVRPGLTVGRCPPGSRRKIVFVFAGQGASWAGMGRELLASEPVFREAIERCDAALRPPLGWSVRDELQADASRSRLSRSDVAQPMFFALQVALAAQWRAWRVVPDAVIGHSVGEVYAANLEDNLQSLLNRAKSGTYRAPPVRRVHIPKGIGTETRPIGIPTFEDKVLQRAVAMVLEAVYEQDFLDCSFGFRPRRSAHLAARSVRACPGNG
ncbi:acyltransferase domain-containing protein [Sorangium sp. So ce381]|uniref:acyltransferase domain-containing protein n=1 Tax=Sorangium sp. So ce381 TaxID=3133307 RepID=UPI003F5B0BCA